MAETTRFKAELRCDYPQWWRYNVFITGVCFDSDGTLIDYITLTDKVYDSGEGAETRLPPPDYDPSRPIAI
jgi:hypothetical protein